MASASRQEDLARPELAAGNTGRNPVQAASIAIIGKGMVIKGQIRSGEHFRVDGEIEGSLQLPSYDLTVGSQGTVRADVSAREVDVAGVIEGNVDATKKITVRKGGRLLGDLRTPGIVIEDGAYFKGKIEIVNSALQADAAAAAKVAAGGSS
jgi:cytoskeletal protein CcmA (bactofilin family)